VEAIKLWERSAELDRSYSVVWRNLGIGYFNVLHNPKNARAAYAKAFAANPNDGRLLFERDQLWKRLGESPEKRLREIAKYPQLVKQRDDLSIELCALYNRTGQPAKALQIVSTRKFHPWEGGEGQALGQYVATHLAIGRKALVSGDAACARQHFEKALGSPENLGEAKHLLANQSDIYYWMGVACDDLADKSAAKQYWTAAAMFRGDFQEMSVRKFSEMTFFSALSWGKLGEKRRMQKMFRELLAFAKALYKEKANIDYFATSLPTMLLFDDDLTFRQQTKAVFMQAQAQLGLGKRGVAQKLLRTVLQREPNHALAAELLTNLHIS
jgi:tetratricopeptide (TPR) repeat protein